MQNFPYKTVRITQDLMGHLVTIARSAFDVNLNIDSLIKEYNTQCFGASYIGFLALEENSGDSAAFYGVFPVELQIQGQTVLVAQSGNTMTHKNHQGKGLFIHLAQRTYQLAESEQIRCVFGFPNKNSYPGFIRKLNWEHINDLNRYTHHVITFPFAYLAKKYQFFRTLYKCFFRKAIIIP